MLQSDSQNEIIYLSNLIQFNFKLQILTFRSRPSNYKETDTEALTTERERHIFHCQWDHTNTSFPPTLGGAVSLQDLATEQQPTFVWGFRVLILSSR